MKIRPRNYTKPLIYSDDYMALIFDRTLVDLNYVREQIQHLPDFIVDYPNDFGFRGSKHSMRDTLILSSKQQIDGTMLFDIETGRI